MIHLTGFFNREYDPDLEQGIRLLKVYQCLSVMESAPIFPIPRTHLTAFCKVREELAGTQSLDRA